MDMGLTCRRPWTFASARANWRKTTSFPHEEELDTNDHASPSETEAAIRQAVRGLQLNAINHKKEYGGQEMTIVQQCIVNEEVGKATNASVGARLAAAGLPAVRQRQSRSRGTLSRRAAVSSARRSARRNRRQGRMPAA